jgi:Helix-turn-helix domain
VETPAHDPGEAPAPRAAYPAGSGIVEVGEVGAMRALTHPVRLALLRVLTEEGSLTATLAGKLIGETFTTCSFHLRQLSKYGFVEEAGGATGRNRPWKLTSLGLRFSASGIRDPEEKVAATALARLTRDQQLGRLEAWTQARDDYPRDWQEAASALQFNLYLTASELARLQEEVIALFLPRFRERIEDPGKRPEGSASVEALFFAYPTRWPGAPGGPASYRHVK